MPESKVPQWQLATVVSVRAESHNVKCFELALPNWQAHIPGQHYLLRLSAEDGYQARRSYSVASSPESKGTIELCIERLAEGEVSSYLHDFVKVGDKIEVRGPLGGYFVWKTAYKSPLWLIAGGSGIVPLMSILRHRALAGKKVPIRLLYSIRSPEEEIFAAELEKMEKADPGFFLKRTYTRHAPGFWEGDQFRINRKMLEEELNTFQSHPLVYVCGPTSMVEFVAHCLVELGVAGVRVRTERFG